MLHLHSRTDVNQGKSGRHPLGDAAAALPSPRGSRRSPVFGGRCKFPLPQSRTRIGSTAQMLAIAGLHTLASPLGAHPTLRHCIAALAALQKRVGVCSSSWAAGAERSAAAAAPPVAAVPVDRLQRAISPQVCERLRRDGYAVVDNVLGEPASAALRAEVAALRGSMHKACTAVAVVEAAEACHGITPSLGVIRPRCNVAWVMVRTRARLSVHWCPVPVTSSLPPPLPAAELHTPGGGRRHRPAGEGACVGGGADAGGDAGGRGSGWEGAGRCVWEGEGGAGQRCVCGGLELMLGATQAGTVLILCSSTCK